MLVIFAFSTRHVLSYEGWLEWHGANIGAEAADVSALQSFGQVG